MKISTKNMIQKCAYMYVATKTHAELKKKFADSGSLLETCVNMFFVHDLSRFCVQYAVCFQQLICQMMI